MSIKERIVDEEVIKALEQIAPSCVKRNIALSEMSWYGIGGNADVIVEPENSAVVSALTKFLKEENILYSVVGDTSNILFDDSGYRGVLIKISKSMGHIETHEDGIIRAGAGVYVPCFVRRVISQGLSGCVHAIGIPGTLGGLVIMNGGSQRKGIGEQLVSVTIVDNEGGIRTLSKEECRFAYRSSYLQEINCIVVEASFQYARGDKDALHKEALSILVERRKKFPRKYPNCGSVFLSNPAMYPIVGPPGKAIEDAGLKGMRKGNAQISPLHGNFIINLGDASSGDVLYLINKCRKEVESRTGFIMDAEVRFLPQDGHLLPAHRITDKVYA
ncbi:MAG: UDP-N-acetylmuramate dehydrogenase [Alcanivorax sp.]